MSVRVREATDLQQRGWARYDQPDILGSDQAPELEGSLEAIQDFFAGLPPDRYEPQSNRFRRHARAVFLPWTGTLSWLPNGEDPAYGEVVDYDMQGYNAEFAGVKRRFPAIPAHIRANPLLERIVRFDLEHTQWLEGFARTPLNVGVGCILLSVKGPADEAVSTPNMLHQDGGAVSFTFVHLIVRRNVVGGVNYIAPPRCVGLLPSELSGDLIEAEFTLEDPLDSFAVHNSRVSHHVSTVRRGDQPGVGQRGVLLVAVSPLVKQL